MAVALIELISELWPCHESTAADWRVTAHSRRTIHLGQETTGHSGRHQRWLYLRHRQATAAGQCMGGWPLWQDDVSFHWINRSPLVQCSARHLDASNFCVASCRTHWQTMLINCVNRRPSHVQINTASCDDVVSFQHWTKECLIQGVVWRIIDSKRQHAFLGNLAH